MKPRRIILLVLLALAVGMVSVQIIRPDAGLELLCYVFAVPVTVLNIWDWIEPGIEAKLFIKKYWGLVLPFFWLLAIFTSVVILLLMRMASLKSTPVTFQTYIQTPTVVSQAEQVLLSNGFVHYAGEDGVNTCRVEGCKVYKSISDGIDAWTYPDSGSFSLIVNSGDQYDAATQKGTLDHVITKIYGEGVYSWITHHLSASVNANQKGKVEGYNITIGLIPVQNVNVIMIVIGRG